MPAKTTIRELPRCQAEGCTALARYDFKTKFGPWAYACPKHWIELRAAPALGLGIGQFLVTEAEARETLVAIEKVQNS